MTTPKHNRRIQVGVRLTLGEYEAVLREAKRRSWTIAQALRHRALKGLTVVEGTPQELTELDKAGGQ